MKKIITVILIALLPGLLPAQHCPYLKKYLLQGEQALQAGRFDAAIRAFTIAITHCPDSAQLGSEGINRTYRALEALKTAAETAREQAVQEQKRAEIEKKRAISARGMAITQFQIAATERDRQMYISVEAIKTRDQLRDSLRGVIRLKKELELAKEKAVQAEIDATAAKDKAILDRVKVLRQISKMYFYKDSFGIAYDNVTQKYGFVDRNMETRIDFEYDVLLPFDGGSGFAKGKIQNNNYLISTQGRRFTLADEIYDINEHIEAIDFRSKSMRSIPYCVYRYPQLKIVMLDRNEIKALRQMRLSRGGRGLEIYIRDIFQGSGRIFGGINTLKNVQTLSISHNKMEHIGRNVRKLKNLRTLNLSNNIIESVAAEIGNLPQLTELDLSNNRLDSLPPQIGQLHQLRRLDLSGNRFSEAELEKIRAWLPQCHVYPEAAPSNGQKQMQ